MYFIFILLIFIFFCYNYYYNNIEYWAQIENYSNKPDLIKWLLTDKFISKKFAEKNGFCVPKTYQHVKNPFDIDFSKLPNNYVIKPVDLCDSYGVHLIKDNINLMTGKKINSNLDIIRGLLNARLEVGNLCYMYYNVYKRPPSKYYIVEELLLEDDNPPCDYKCYTFSGKIYYIAVTFNRRIEKTQKFDVIWMTRDFQPIKTKMLIDGYKSDAKINKPPELDELIKKVEAVSIKLKRHCRIDCYIYNKKIYLSEFTFYPGAFLHTKICNFKLGLLYKMYPDKNIYLPDIEDCIPKDYKIDIT